VLIEYKNKIVVARAIADRVCGDRCEGDRGIVPGGLPKPAMELSAVMVGAA
jgi:hypothetical protein